GFVEMSAAGTGRLSPGTLLSPPVLNETFRRLDPNGELMRAGYYFRIFLPGPAGAAVGEPPQGFTTESVDARLAAAHWCACAWPAEYAETGKRPFFVRRTAEALASEFNGYGGKGGGPIPSAPFSDAPAITAG